jgi:hypothetical protein
LSTTALLDKTHTKELRKEGKHRDNIRNKG